VNAPHPPPAGWYPDPSGRAPFRYWDGAQWTEHTNQGTPPSPSVGQAPAAPMAQMAPGAPAQAGYGGPYGGGAPAGMTAAPARPATTGPLTAQSLIEDLKRLEGFAVMVAAGLLFIIFSFFPWANSELTGVDQSTGLSATETDSLNAWDGDGAWWIRGWDVSLENLQSAARGQAPDSGTDMIILLPAALAALGVAGAMRTGKAVSRGNEIALGASGLLALLMVGEVVHLNGVNDDLKDIFTSSGLIYKGGVGFGMYLSTAAAFALAYGAFRLFQGSRAAAPAGGPPAF
jgi:hypothetical protein